MARARAIDRAVADTVAAARSFAAQLLARGHRVRSLPALAERCARISGASPEPRALADMVAQSAVCAAAVVESRAAFLAGIESFAAEEPVLAAVLREVVEVFGARLGFGVGRGFGAGLGSGAGDGSGVSSGASVDPFFYERFLASHEREERRAVGAFYTPAEVVAAVVEGAHAGLQERLGLPLGLADDTTWGELVARGAVARPPELDDGAWDRLAVEPYVRILDPAVGAGAFLLAVVDLCRRTLEHAWREPDPAARDRRWRAHLVRRLLPRLCGCEISAPPFVVAHLTLGRALAAATAARPFRLWWADALAPEAFARAAPITVVLGNPPYRGLSRGHGPWIDDLLTGRSPAARPAASYFAVDGRPLGERKTWLRDDYVRFFRLAQHYIENSGSGVVALVTNHGYLDNPTFRGMRQALLTTFDRVSILDLGGNARRPAPERDESVFGIRQGVAIGVLARGGETRPDRERGAAASEVTYRRLRGRRADKLARLGEAAAAPAAVLRPQTPFYFLTPRADHDLAEYRVAWSLADAMPCHGTGVITARDGLAVDFAPERLLERVADLRGTELSDAEIRARYFANKGAARYPPGDTRGWKLPAARERLRADPDWRERVRPYRYRPLDERWLYATPALVDWPRPEIMGHLASGATLALCTCRQTSGGPWRHVLPTRGLTDDSYLSNRSRERTYLFPLHLSPDATPNFAPAFVAAAEAVLGLAWRPRGHRDPTASFGPEEMAAYAYALMSATSYRERYAEALQCDFPRLPLPATPALFTRLAAAGQRLLALHLMEGEIPTCPGLASRAGYIENIPDEIWSLELGGFRVAQKWLRDRQAGRAGAGANGGGGARGRDRPLDDHGVRHYLRLVAALNAGLAVVAAIDDELAAAGGLPAALAPAP